MIVDQINQDYIRAMKERDSLKSSTLSFLRAQIKNVIIDKKLEQMEDEEAIAVIKKQVKQRQDSIEQYETGGRTDLADKEKLELEILKTYLPEEMSEAELKPIIDETIKETGATGMKDMGHIMKVIVPKIQGRADMKMVSDLVKKALAS